MGKYGFGKGLGKSKLGSGIKPPRSSFGSKAKRFGKGAGRLGGKGLKKAGAFGLMALAAGVGNLLGGAFGGGAGGAASGLVLGTAGAVGGMFGGAGGLLGDLKGGGSTTNRSVGPGKSQGGGSLGGVSNSKVVSDSAGISGLSKQIAMGFNSQNNIAEQMYKVISKGNVTASSQRQKITQELKRLKVNFGNQNEKLITDVRHSMFKVESRLKSSIDKQTEVILSAIRSMSSGIKATSEKQTSGLMKALSLMVPLILGGVGGLLAGSSGDTVTPPPVPDPDGPGGDKDDKKKEKEKQKKNKRDHARKEREKKEKQRRDKLEKEREKKEKQRRDIEKKNREANEKREKERKKREEKKRKENEEKKRKEKQRKDKEKKDKDKDKKDKSNNKNKKKKGLFSKVTGFLKKKFPKLAGATKFLSSSAGLVSQVLDSPLGKTAGKALVYADMAIGGYQAIRNMFDNDSAMAHGKELANQSTMGFLFDTISPGEGLKRVGTLTNMLFNTDKIQNESINKAIMTADVISEEIKKQQFPSGDPRRDLIANFLETGQKSKEFQNLIYNTTDPQEVKTIGATIAAMGIPRGKRWANLNAKKYVSAWQLIGMSGLSKKEEEELKNTEESIERSGWLVKEVVNNQLGKKPPVKQPLAKQPLAKQQEKLDSLTNLQNLTGKAMTYNASELNEGANAIRDEDMVEGKHKIFDDDLFDWTDERTLAQLPTKELLRRKKWADEDIPRQLDYIKMAERDAKDTENWKGTHLEYKHKDALYQINTFKQQHRDAIDHQKAVYSELDKRRKEKGKEEAKQKAQTPQPAEKLIGKKSVMVDKKVTKSSSMSIGDFSEGKHAVSPTGGVEGKHYVLEDFEGDDYRVDKRTVEQLTTQELLDGRKESNIYANDKSRHMEIQKARKAMTKEKDRMKKRGFSEEQINRNPRFLDFVQEYARVYTPMKTHYNKSATYSAELEIRRKTDAKGKDPEAASNVKTPGSMTLGGTVDGAEGVMDPSSESQGQKKETTISQQGAKTTGQSIDQKHYVETTPDGNLLMPTLQEKVKKGDALASQGTAPNIGSDDAGRSTVKLPDNAEKQTPPTGDTGEFSDEKGQKFVEGKHAVSPTGGVEGEHYVLEDFEGDDFRVDKRSVEQLTTQELLEGKKESNMYANDKSRHAEIETARKAMEKEKDRMKKRGFSDEQINRNPRFLEFVQEYSRVYTPMKTHYDKYKSYSAELSNRKQTQKNTVALNPEKGMTGESLPESEVQVASLMRYKRRKKAGLPTMPGDKKWERMGKKDMPNTMDLASTDTADYSGIREELDGLKELILQDNAKNKNNIGAMVANSTALVAGAEMDATVASTQLVSQAIQANRPQVIVPDINTSTTIENVNVS